MQTSRYVSIILVALTIMWAVDNVAVTDQSEKYADRALEYYKVFLDNNFITDTDTTFYQYGDNGEVLVPGQTYLAEVAAVYSTGISERMFYEWTYYPCDSFPGPEYFNAENVEGTDNVLLTWSNTTPPPPDIIVLVDETFEDYTAGDPLAEQAQAMGRDYWTTWSETPGSTEDPLVSDAQAEAGDNSVVIEAPNDCVLLLDAYTEGVFNIDFDIYIPTDKVGYFNVLQSFAGAASSWGTQTYFDPNGTGRTDAGGADAGLFAFTYDTWHHVYIQIDLDNDYAEMFFNGTSVVSWVWSTGAFGTNSLNEFNAMNFFSYEDTGTAGAFFDNVSITMEPPSNRSTDDVLVGANLYRDGMMIAETVTDTSYLDEGLEAGYYDYCITYVYESGAESCMSMCVNDVLVPEECTAPANLTATLDEETYSSIYLEWDSSSQTLVEITQNPGDPANGYFQSYDYGYGVVYDLTAYPDALANSIEFHHASWGTTGTWEYNIHIVDWDTKTAIAVLGPFTTTGNDLWETGIDLGDIDLMGATKCCILNGTIKQ